MADQVAGSADAFLVSVEEGKKRRAWKPKVKTGCITCRQRRVKCDEAKPFCNRCNKAKRSCGGYTTGPASRTFLDEQLLELNRPLDILHTGTAKEREALHFFYKQTTPDLAGFFESSFWQRDLPQAVWHHQPLRDTVIALAVLHREFMGYGGRTLPVDNSSQEISFALEHYNRATNEIARTHTVDVTTTLTFCILSHCFSWFQGYLVSALGHLRAGLRILRAIDEGKISVKQDAQHSIPFESLRSLLVRLDIQVRAMMVRDQLQFWEPKPKSVPRSLTGQYVDFDTVKSFIEEAFDEIYGFFQLMDTESGFTTEVYQQQAKILTNQYQRAIELFDGALSRSWAPLSEQQERSLLVLGIHRRQVDIFIDFYSSDKTQSEMNWDAWEDEFKLMLHSAVQILEGEPPSDQALSNDSMADTVLESLHTTATSTVAKAKGKNAKVLPKQRPVLTFGAGVVPSLWLIIFRCRNPEIRRAVIRLLLRHPRREGFWDGTMLAGLGQRLVDAEEANCTSDDSITHGNPDWRVRQASDIPERHRIVRAMIHYTGPRSVSVNFATRTQRERGEGGFTYTLAW